MGLSKLNIWIRDERCKPYYIEKEKGDWVVVRHCDGARLRGMPINIPVGVAHVEVDVPPGCYIVQGHVCDPKVNRYTDKAIAVVGCGQEVCVNLILPTIVTCVRRDLPVFLDEARRAGVATADLETTARTILTAGEVGPDDLVARMENRISEYAKATDLVADFKQTLSLFQGFVRGTDSA